jgi:tetratricopeptide (TPR) repeat protein
MRFAAARIAMKRRDINDAYARYRECTPDWSDSPLFWGGLGLLYLKNEQMEDAVVAFQRALFLRPDIPEVWANLGLIYDYQGQAENASRVYSTGLANCREDQLLKERLAQIGPRKNAPRPGIVRDLIELDGSQYFQQPAEKIALKLLENAPDLSGSSFMTEPGIAEHSSDLFLAFQSLFGT